ncbi:thioredoxin domain-containing protein [Rhodohalobacter mucosus]|uniref:Thioredoxin domain-containing protein n=1 Tax=Rhodohalobacter mucosus TaxID=2079485 RepID=A0A316TYT3_9BACT|nr:thioredoxin domain-containing protein [Rhodohalobacter mucosus]PWN05086.1 thioredoxin domain-containing protein [Rhodohalobacter mucosus]
MNQLGREKSPYLLQHADNPVEWYPWGEEAFEKARNEDKPVFLSIGYATCHWCHVMAHESFEDDGVAELMNRTFVNIKVDREERPDIDNTYMTVCQMITGQGGWPLTIIMTPEKEPFYAATYLPRHSHPNRIGMYDLVPAINKAWKEDRDRILESVDRIKKGFSRSLELGRSGGSLTEKIEQEAFDSLKQRYDRVHGGFGGSPKFPSPHNLTFLIDYSRLTGNDEASEMAAHTLEQMRLGGIWDHVGGGFHRYSTDEEWLLPHFEKMLYDQALMLRSYAEAFKLTHKNLFQKTSEEIVQYLDECLTSPGGGFYSAEDADSEGEEGTFYVWRKGEIEDILDPKDAAIFCDLYGVQDDGNYYDEATRQKTGSNIPHLSGPIPRELEEQVSGMLRKLHEHRRNRERPLLDDKILTDWNGLMIGSMARAGILLENPSFIERAENACTFVIHQLTDENGSLLHRYRNGDAGITGMADDYAFFIHGLIELYQATFNPDYLERAVRLQKEFTRDFYDDKHGGFFFTHAGAEKLLGRQKEIYDGAIPSSNSMAVMNGYILSRLTGNMDFERQASATLNAFSEQMSDAPAGYAHAIHAHMLMGHDSREIVICTEERGEISDRLIQICREYSGPGSTILLKTKQTQNILNRVAPYTKPYPVKREIAVYVCSGFACKAPIHTPEQLIEILSG